MNIDAFNQFTCKVLANLYEVFPDPIRLDYKNYVDDVELSPTPPSPVDLVVGPSPDFWPGMDSIEDYNRRLVEEYDWASVIENVQVHLHRKLTEQEKADMRKLGGKRPPTEEEAILLTAWKEEKARIAEVRKTELAKQDETDTKRRLLAGTLQFLVNEKLIRYIDIRPPNADLVVNPPDILVRNSVLGTAKIQYVLTAHGLAQLNKVVKNGEMISDTTYQRIKQTLLPKAGEGAITGAASMAIGAMGPLVSSILS